MEPLSAALVTFGIAILFSSWVMLIIASFRDDFTWGLSSVFVPPVAYFYGLFRWQKANDALLLAGLGWLLIFFA